MQVEVGTVNTAFGSAHGCLVAVSRGLYTTCSSEMRYSAGQLVFVTAAVATEETRTSVAN